MKTLLVAVPLLLLCSLLSAKQCTISVEPSKGVDLRSCGSATVPCRSIAGAITIADATCSEPTIILLAGTYNGSRNILSDDLPLTKFLSLSLIGDNRNSVLLGNGTHAPIQLSSTHFDLSLENVYIADSINGGIRIERSRGELSLSKCSINNCSSNDNGGGLYVDTTNNVYIVDSFFTECQSAQNGGGLYITSSSKNVQIKSAHIYSNVAKRNGGGAYLLALNTLTSTHIHDNVAINGSGLYLQNLATGIVDKGDIHDNHGSGSSSSSSCGGGLFSDNSNVQVKGSSLTNNSADYGAGLFVKQAPHSSPKFVLSSSEVHSNVATYKGGGLYCASSGAQWSQVALAHNSLLHPQPVFKENGTSDAFCESSCSDSCDRCHCQSCDACAAFACGLSDGCECIVPPSNVDVCEDAIDSDDGDHRGLIVGLAIGLGLPVLLSVLIGLLFFYRWRRTRQPQYTTLELKEDERLMHPL